MWILVSSVGFEGLVVLGCRLVSMVLMLLLCVSVVKLVLSVRLMELLVWLL